MNIFIVARPPLVSVDASLINRLAGVIPEPRKNTPVIVVDDVMCFPGRAGDSAPVDHTWLRMEHFMSRFYVLEPNIIFRHMNKVATDWVLIDFGQHELSICKDFIVKLARYNYSSSRLRECNLVFSAPAVSIGVLARLLNESFNNLPTCHVSQTKARQLRRLFILIHMKRVLARLPLLESMLMCVHRISRRLFKRLLRIE